MLKTSNNIKLKVQKKHNNFDSLMKAILKSEEKFTYEIVSDQLATIKVNPLYRSFWMHGHNPGRFIEAKISAKSLNNVNPIIEIEEETISNKFAIILAVIIICIVIYSIWNYEYIIAIGAIGISILSITILHLINLHGISCFTGELIDEIEK